MEGSWSIALSSDVGQESHHFISNASFNSFSMEGEVLKGKDGFSLRMSQNDDNTWVASQPCIVDNLRRILTVSSMFPTFIDVNPPASLQR